MKNDAHTTLQELRDQVHRFNDERDWHQFHTPQNVAASIAIEVAELLEHFQWTTEPEPTAKRRSQVVEELADVVIYCLTMANALDVDLSQAVRRKLAQNATKYPRDEYRGRF
jgi:NTP pyrophosphatase (non-canonical NTP hydrolase)